MNFSNILRRALRPLVFFVRPLKSWTQLKNGFTMAEIIIVLSLITIISAIIIPSVLVTERASLKRTALALRSDLRSMQRLSIAEGVGTSITISPEHGMYTLSKQIVAKTATNTLSGKYEPVRTVYLPDNVEFESYSMLSKQILYTMNGTVDKANRIDLKSKNYTVKMTLNVGAGNVKIYEIERLE